MKWVTRADAKVDRIACPWLIQRFVDPAADLLHVPAGEVLAVAEREEAIPDDVPDVELGHVGGRCSFGLKAIAHGFSLVHGDDDRRKLELEFPLYGALYAWCQADAATTMSRP